MAQDRAPQDDGRAQSPIGSSPVVLVCEHASNHIPAEFDGLGLTDADRSSHAAWDPGALAVAQGMARHLDATLVAGRVSRLVCDCNRPADAPDIMPARSEVIEVPGNRDLAPAARAARIDAYHRPFHDALHRSIERMVAPIVVTIHSFTPIYHGRTRTVEIGVLHDADTRLANAMLDVAATRTDATVERNEPYGPDDGVTHTLREHAIRHGHPNVMLEIRNDLIATPAQQDAMAALLSDWLVTSVARLQLPTDARCRA